MAEGYKHMFKVEKVLGKGSMGSVFLVKSKEDKKQYALKVVQVGLQTKDVFKEFKLMSEMEHRNIVKMYAAQFTMDANGSVNSLGIQMQYCPNGDLRNYLAGRKGKILTEKKLTSWMSDLASAVEYIHSMNVLHRDLKPDNILLTASDILKLSDFGIAKFVGKAIAHTIAGTPLFIAPEILTGQGYNEKADIFSLGRVFLCIATASPAPVDLSYVPECYDDSVYNLIRRCTLDNPGRRPTSKTVFKDVYKMAMDASS